MDLTLRYYLDDFIAENRIDTLVLGCTHYPLIAPNLQRLYPGIRIIYSLWFVPSRRKRAPYRSATAGLPAPCGLSASFPARILLSRAVFPPSAGNRI